MDPRRRRSADWVDRKAHAQVGVGLYSVAPYYLRPPRRSGMLLGYGPLKEREIKEGIKRLASALARPESGT